jgi:hypothetical protein
MLLQGITSVVPAMQRRPIVVGAVLPFRIILTGLAVLAVLAIHIR